MKKLHTFFYILLLSYPLLVQGQLPAIVINQGGGNRVARIYIPSGYTGEEPWPLVLNFHGALSDIDGQVAHGMNEAAETEGFLVVYPQGMEVELSNVSNFPFLPAQGTGWNIGGGLSGNDDLAFIGSLLDKIEADYNIDPTRIYATGFSMGGMMSYYLACSFPGHIAAVAVVAGNLSKPGGFYDCQPDRAIPVLHIHGTDEVLSPYYSSAAGNPLYSALESVQFWVSNNNCTGDPVETEAADIDTEDESTVTIIHYDNCADDSEVLLYRVNGGAHSWPGTSVPPPTNAGQIVVGKVNMDINANEEILAFFGQHSLTSTRSLLRPEEVDLSVFPSPFSDQLTFTFELPEAARVRLTVFNSLGQTVQILVDQRLSAGKQRLEWRVPDARLPEGMYYYRLWIDGRFVSRPVVKQ